MTDGTGNKEIFVIFDLLEIVEIDDVQRARVKLMFVNADTGRLRISGPNAEHLMAVGECLRLSGEVMPSNASVVDKQKRIENGKCY